MSVEWSLLDLSTREGSVTRSLYTLGERYSVAVQAKGALLSRICIHIIYMNNTS